MAIQHSGNARQRPSLPAPIEIAKFWKNRGRNESLRISLSEFEGHCIVNVRIYSTGADGIDRPTPKGVAMGIRKLPELAKALNDAVDKARELGLIDGDAQ